MLARGGTYSVIGYGGMIAVPSAALVVNEHAVVGNLVGTWVDLWELLQLHAAGRVVLKTEMHPLDSVNDVLAEAPRRRGHRPRSARSLGLAVTQLTRLGVCEAAALLAQRSVSSSELVAACLARIRERDGAHSHDGRSGVGQCLGARLRGGSGRGRGARRRASRAPRVRRDGPAPALTGIPLGLKDLYGVAGKPLTASSSLLDDVPTRTATSGAGCARAG